MRIIAFKTLKEYYQKNPTSKIGLENWYEIAKNAKWKDFNDLKEDFKSADYVGNKRFVFNISGNNYRLIVKIIFIAQIIFVRFIGTHAEYDKIEDCSTI